MEYIYRYTFWESLFSQFSANRKCDLNNIGIETDIKRNRYFVRLWIKETLRSTKEKRLCSMKNVRWWEITCLEGLKIVSREMEYVRSISVKKALLVSIELYTYITYLYINIYIIFRSLALLSRNDLYYLGFVLLCF